MGTKTYIVNPQAHTLCMLVPEYENYVWEYAETDPDWWAARVICLFEIQGGRN